MNKTSPATASHGVILMTAQRMHRLALQRGYYFYTNLFKNPPWLIMLNLFVSQLSDMPANPASIKIANRLTDEEFRATAKQLVEEGMITFGDDELITLTPLGSKQMDGFIREILKSREAEGQ
jgi:hypothetical protein